MSQAIQNQVTSLRKELDELRAELKAMREQMKLFALKRGPQKQEHHDAAH